MFISHNPSSRVNQNLYKMLELMERGHLTSFSISICAIMSRESFDILIANRMSKFVGCNVASDAKT